MCPIKLKIVLLYHMTNNLQNTAFYISVNVPLIPVKNGVDFHYLVPIPATEKNQPNKATTSLLEKKENCFDALLMTRSLLYVLGSVVES